ncbi:peptidyl-prolyl cis-trans isomerase [Paenibacillus ehimensis]|uniref:peptidylprolyl isomerase n=1 Tax=Paenibacillus ehimensis TaxID=79264 RepID=A0ABT8VL86_9BACL|nr:peptidyl-prolyl cis-trans isomerase [Paenibacillus ehimensis]MDO3681753.1 peptidyl-prolyl cis-trans isomerase [Paenibacillus ehimensis]MEC0212974.1 peptidyl-prolyl cis-trans isomerase [Paenibacillus ehimensis]
MRNIKVLWGMIAVLLVAVVILSSVLMAHSLYPSPTDKHPDPQKQDGEAQILATIGEKKITFAELETQLLAAHGRELLDRMIDREVVRLEAKALGIEIGDNEVQQELKRMKQGYESEQEFLETMKNQLGLTPDKLKEDVYHKLLADKVAIHNIRITDEEVQAYISAHPDEFQTRVELRLQQIVTSSKEQAQRALNDLAKGADFAQVAKERSLDDATRDSGGDLGWLEEGDPFVPAPVMKIAKQLKQGEIGKPVEVDGKYVIVKLRERKETSKEEPAAIQERVRKDLALREAPPMKEILRTLRDKWKVSVQANF